MTVIYLTGTLNGTQVWNVPADWNNNANSVEVVSAGGDGSDETTDCCGNGRGDDAGGGSGGYARAANITLTAGGTTSYQLRDHGAGSGTACWFGGTTLALSKAGIENGGNASGGSSGSGASTAGGVGSTLTAGNGGGGQNSGYTAPPSAAGTAASGSGVPAAGYGGQANAGGGDAGVQGVIVITYTPKLYTALERGLHGVLRGVAPGSFS